MCRSWRSRAWSRLTEVCDRLGLVQTLDEAVGSLGGGVYSGDCMIRERRTAGASGAVVGGSSFLRLRGAAER